MDRSRRGRIVCYLHKGGDLWTEMRMRILSGVVYMTKSKRPRNDPWGTPQRQVTESIKKMYTKTN